MSDKPLQDDELFLRLADETETAADVGRAPSRLKSKTYSALIRRQEQSGPLLNIVDTRRAGHGLCVFESLWSHMPLGTSAKCFNCCSICHARVLGENVEPPPIYWGHCPYVAFKKS
ncbi:MAG: hypothetical protein ACLQVL_28290 [Terriglobia bacterium]